MIIIITCDIWQMAGDKWHFVESEHFSKNTAPLLLLFVIYEFKKRFWGKGLLTESVNEWMNECGTGPPSLGILNIYLDK